MKQLSTIVGIMILCSAVCYAQIPNCDAPTPHPQLAFEALKNLDKSQIPTGVLAEYAYPLEEVEYYDGTANTDTSNYSKFLQVYYQLYLATFNRTNIAHLSDYEKAIHNFHPDREFHHPVGIIDYQFNTIDLDAINNNLMYVSNEQLYDVSNRTQSPYLTKTTKLVNMLFDKGSDCIKSGIHYLHFSPNFVLSNTGFSLNDVQAIEIKLNNVVKYSGSVSGLNNVEIPIVIISVDKDITVTMLLTLPTEVKTYQFSICQLPIQESCEGGDVITVTGYPFNGGYGEETYSSTALASIYYAKESCSSRIITKPIIFIDGFDPGNVQHAYDIYTKYLNKEFDDNGPKKLGDELRANGFDIIIFDPIATPNEENYKRGGVGFIENNGLALAKFLETFYAEHSSTMTQDFVIVGASMGGLIARFGLSWMEKNNKAHHTRLFISFDSPQAGAQIPLGLQQFVDTFTQVGILATVEGVRNALHQSNAAKQMLLWHSSTNSEIPQPHPHRSIFLNNLVSVGNYPTQCRNIAIVDGNRGGILKTTTPVPQTEPPTPAINERDKELDLGIKRRIFPNCTQSFCYKLHAQVYAQTASIRSKSYEFDMATNNILLNVASNSFGIRSFIKYAQTTNNTSIDIAPGSRIRKDPLEKAEPWMLNLAHVLIGKVNISTNNIKFSSFVPFISAIDYTFPNNEPYNAYKNFQGIILSKCAGTTPFDTVYAPTQDLDHVDINAYIANAFKSEVYYPKAKSPCADANCPEYITLNSMILRSQIVLKRAQKAIFIEPDFKADGANGGLVFKAAIGCDQTLNANKNPKTSLSVATLCSQPFEFDQTRNYKTCDGTNTTFHVFVHNIDISTYAEFSVDGTNYFKANILDNGYEITLPNDTNPQVFFARSADNRSNVIGGYLAFCN